MICTPVFVPVIKSLGFDPLWFGVLFIMNMEMGYLTPPFGFNLFYMKAIAPPGVTMGDIYRSDRSLCGPSGPGPGDRDHLSGDRPVVSEDAGPVRILAMKEIRLLEITYESLAEHEPLRRAIIEVRNRAREGARNTVISLP